MIQLVYFSPVPWDSFSQRPHHFVKWFAKKYHGKVLWVDPYPTRLPTVADFFRGRKPDGGTGVPIPSYMELIKPRALPIEPVPLLNLINKFVWKNNLNKIAEFAQKNKTVMAIGKPSAMAHQALKEIDSCYSLYDAMDDFSHFYRGLSKFSMKSLERKIAKNVTVMVVSSTQLKQNWTKVRDDIQIIHNGLDETSIPQNENRSNDSESKVFGYVGTIGAWFDWNWLITLAKLRPYDEIRAIGPQFNPAPVDLPKNIKLLPARPHVEALLAIKEFDVALIPFKINDLTDSVDPIKFYEYRAVGVPILSSRFGEMVYREKESGVFITNFEKSHELEDQQKIQLALDYRQDLESITEFIGSNSWKSRFNTLTVPSTEN